MTACLTSRALVHFQLTEVCIPGISQSGMELILLSGGEETEK